MKSREQLNSGTSAKFKKRHQKDLPISTREAIVKMYLVDHVFQKDVAKYFKIPAALVGKLVKEAQNNPEKQQNLKIKENDIKKAFKKIK